MRDDRELLRSYVEHRSHDAFAELVNRYLDLVYSAALRKLNGDTHRAKDIAQAVFIKLATHSPTLPDDRVLAGWLYTTAHNTASKAIRSEVRRRQREQEAQMMHAITAEDAAPPDWQQVRPVLDDAMHELNGPDRDAILLRFFERRPFAEIGDKLGLSENAARMRVERALDKLHGLLASRGIRSTGAAFGVLLTSEAIVAAPAGLASGIITAAAGAVAGSSLTTVTVLTTMTTAKLTALVSVVGLSIAANLVLVAKLKDHHLPLFPDFTNAAASLNSLEKNLLGNSGPNSPAETAARAPGAVPASTAGGQTSVPTFELLASKDPAVFAANLRAAGFSSPAIRGAVNRLLRETEESHRVEVLRSVPLAPFWNTTDNGQITGPQMAEYLRLRLERATTFNHLFPEEMETYQLGLRRRYGPLPEDKLTKLDQIDSDYNQMQQQFSGRTVMPWDSDARALLKKESRTDIEALLTPQELEEFNLRTAPTAARLRDLVAFNPTETEFKTLYQLRAPYDEKFQISPGLTVLTPEQRQAEAQAQRDLNAQIKAVLGETRYAEYTRAADPGFQQTYSLTRQLNLPPENALSVYQIQQEAQQRAAAIRSGAGTVQTPAERTEQLRQLAQEASARLSPLLTPAGFEAYKRRGGAWLQSLDPASAPRPQTPSLPSR